MRNFSLFLVAGVDPRRDNCSFDAILEKVRDSLRSSLAARPLLSRIGRNVGIERHPLVRMTPLFLKKPLARYFYVHGGENSYSGSLSNLGLIHLSEGLREHVLEIDTLPSPNPVNRVRATVTGYDGTLRISFGRTIREDDLEMFFFGFLADLGVPAQIADF